jgi:hypothetical protein
LDRNSYILFRQPAPVFPSLNGAAVNLSLDKLISQQKQQQANEDSKLNELLQQLPGDLVNAMLAATATNTVAGGNSAADGEFFGRFHFLVFGGD